MVLFGTNGCVTLNKPVGESASIATDLLPYVNNFVEHSQGKVKYSDLSGLNMTIESLDPGLAGVCYPVLGKPVVKINSLWWSVNKSPYSRTELVYHELAHCILHRHHTSPTTAKGMSGDFERAMFRSGWYQKIPNLSDNCPPSIMHFSTVPINCLVKHQKYYIDELFGHEGANTYPYRTIQVHLEVQSGN